MAKRHKAAAVSKQKFQETLYNKYLALQARNKEIQEELGKLHLKNSSAKASQEELIISRQAQRALNQQLGQAEGKIGNLESRLLYSTSELTKVQNENNSLKALLEKEREEKEALKRDALRRELQTEIGDAQQHILHIACNKGKTSDEVLSYDISSVAEMECYEDEEEEVKCHHILIMRHGTNLTARGWNIRKRKCRPPGVEPPSKRARN